MLKGQRPQHQYRGTGGGKDHPLACGQGHRKRTP
jgi:hypothetical protein